MLFDARMEIRQRALRKIVHIREKVWNPKKVRPYKKPIINFNGRDYFEMIDLNDDKILFEPPFTANIPYDHLVQYIDVENPPFLDPGIACHIQSIERHVQLLSSTSRRGYGNDIRKSV